MGRFGLSRCRGRAREAKDSRRSVGVPSQHCFERGDRFGGASNFNQDFTEQFGRRLDRRRQPERSRELRLRIGGGPKHGDRFVPPPGAERDERGELAVHDRDGRPQIAFARILRTLAQRVPRALGERRIAAARRADADREQFVGVSEVALRRHERPARRFDDIPRPHGRQVAEERQVARRFDDWRELIDRRPRVAVPAELQQLVLQPRERVVVPQCGREAVAGDPRLGCRKGGAVRRRGVVPLSELQEDVRRHVPRVARFGREPCERARGREREVRVLRVVVVVHQIVQRASMLRIRSQYAVEDRRDTRLRVAAGERRAVAFVGVGRADQTARHRAEQGERVQRGDIGIVGLPRVQLAHGVRVVAAARLGVAVAEQAFDRAEPRLLLRASGLRTARGRRGAEPGQRQPRGFEVLVAPQRLVVGHRLAPVRHDEAGIELTSLSKSLVRVLVLELMERSESAPEHSCRVYLCEGAADGSDNEQARHQRGDNRSGDDFLHRDWCADFILLSVARRLQSP